MIVDIGGELLFPFFLFCVFNYYYITNNGLFNKLEISGQISFKSYKGLANGLKNLH